jgi:2-keto-4-pentenoate hydratase/2-oxohepta-3-ene-1,7-dioic acid hydratase in catechol pathway
MKICRFQYKNNVAHGINLENEVVLIPDFDFSREISDSLLQGKKIHKNEIGKFLPPVSPSKIVCVGRNYAEHAKELGNEVPQEPLLFLKAPSSIITNSEEIIIPKQSNQVEHEGELAVVIGRSCKNLSETDDPIAYVFGYMCLNDVTARDLQRKDVQFTRAKSFDTFCPISSFIETDLDFSDIAVKTFVNGKLKQNGKTSRMVFTIPFLIRYISNQMTLNSGDIIATGTPSGVSKMNVGDIVSVEIEGVGCLENPIVS